VNLYQEKQDYFLNELNLKNTSTTDFYNDIFPPGSFEIELGKMDVYPKTKKGNGFIVYTSKNDTKHTRMVFDNHKEIFNLLNNDCAFMAPISYYGKNRTAKNARQLYALTFDLDEVGREELNLLLTYHFDSIPRPTYIVNSGGGVHLYYVLKEPMPMTPTNQRLMKELKFVLTSIIWNEDTSRLKDKQYQGLNQGFRLVGGKTKNGEEVTAWKVGEKVDIEYLIGFTPGELNLHYHEYRFDSKMSLEEAKKKYPDWYHQRIELGREKKNWTCKRDLYDWWKRQLTKTKYHHRYFYIMSLACYAVKCGISEEELRTDAYSFLEYLNLKSPANPFTEDDIESALECYNESYRTFPREDIEKITGIEIPKNKRNGRTQSAHLVRARAMRDINQAEQGTKWNGRLSAEKTVFAFLEQNPNAKAKDFCKQTGMHRATFFKYKKIWNQTLRFLDN
jgi:hypothetical protein